jgi:nucleotide-binding universal stress UspA family protein
MNWKRILCPVDLTQTCSDCVRIASALARECQAELVFLYVAVPELPASSGAAIPEVNQAIEQERQILKQVQPAVPGVLHRHELVRGQPATAIVNYATQNQIDLVVMPTHGRSGISRLLLGSVTEEVLRHAPCPVLAIRATAPHPQPENAPQLAVT